MTTAENKESVRRLVLARLAALTPADMAAHSAAVARRLQDWPGLLAARCLLAYVSTGTEIDTQGLIRGWLGAGRRVCVPVFNRAARAYAAVAIRDFDADLQAGYYGILEPRPGAGPRVPATEWDAVIVPGVAFDAAGHRLGRGRGYIDRLLAATRARTVALAHQCQVVAEVPVADHDAAVDFILTEHQLIDCQPRADRGLRNQP